MIQRVKSLNHCLKTDEKVFPIMALRGFLESVRKGFRPAEAKASRTGPLIALSGSGRPVWTPRDYAALAREGYARNPVVHRAVAEGRPSSHRSAWSGQRRVHWHPHPHGVGHEWQGVSRPQESLYVLSCIS